VTPQLRILLAAMLAYVAVVGVPQPSPPVPPDAVPTIVVETPSAEMQDLVAAVAYALKDASIVDRALWASTLQKVGIVAQGDGISGEMLFSDTRAMRLYTMLALDIAWRRIGGNEPGKYDGLREAVEVAFERAIGLEVQPVTPELRDAYVRLCNALAWCGVGRG